MPDQVITKVQQARVHARAGSMDKAIPLLEQARAMARGDKQHLVIILRELVDAYNSTGRKEQADMLAGELATLAPGESTGVVDLIPFEKASGGSRKLVLATGTLAGLLVVAIGVVIWLMAGRYYGSLPPASQQTGGESTQAQPAAGSVSSSGSGLAAGPTNQPTGSAISGQGSTAGSVVSPSPASRPAPSAIRAGTANVSRETLIRENVGFLLQVARYQGIANGRMCQFEVPCGSGTCFAVGRNGIMLTNKHVTAVDQIAVPADCGQWNMPTLTRRNIRLMVCLGPNASDHYEAQVLHESPRYDLAIIKVKRPFGHPLALAGGRPTLSQQVYAVGFPGVVANVLQEGNAQQILSQVATAAAKGSVSYPSWFSADAYEPTLTRGIVSTTERRLDGASYVQIDATITEGNSGGPLLTDSNEVVGICSSGIAGHESYNFALSIPQIRSEIEQRLKQP